MSSPAPDTDPSAISASPPRPAALIVWRLLSMLYDLFPVLALWMVAGAIFAVGYTLAGHDPHENIRPFSLLQWLLWLVCWVISGLYATTSWRRGGQTLGMRPWRLRVTGADGEAASWKALWLRYAVGSLSLAVAGLGFWWALFDRDRLTWHDRASATRTLRLPKRKK